MPYRHKQLCSAENLNKQLGTIFNLYMNSIEEITGEAYREWLDILPYVRTELNKARAKKYTSKDIAKQPMPSIEQIPKALFAVGELVHYRLSYPRSGLDVKQPTALFRAGDYYFSHNPVKIKKVVQMNDPPYNRYVLESIPQTSFSAFELIRERKPKNNPEQKIVKIWNKEMRAQIPYYLVQFKGMYKANSLYIKESDLIKKGFQKQLDAYNKKK